MEAIATLVILMTLVGLGIAWIIASNKELDKHRRKELNDFHARMSKNTLDALDRREKQRCEMIRKVNDQMRDTFKTE